jgi:hypothetical protein
MLLGNWSPMPLESWFSVILVMIGSTMDDNKAVLGNSLCLYSRKVCLCLSLIWVMARADFSSLLCRSQNLLIYEEFWISFVKMGGNGDWPLFIDQVNTLGGGIKGPQPNLIAYMSIETIHMNMAGYMSNILLDNTYWMHVGSRYEGLRMYQMTNKYTHCWQGSFNKK